MMIIGDHLISLAIIGVSFFGIALGRLRNTIGQMA